MGYLQMSYVQVFCSSFQSLAAENWKERRPKEELTLGVTSEIYLLERVLRVGAAMVTSETSQLIKNKLFFTMTA